MQQQIADCLKETVGKYYEFDEEELIEVVEKLYNVFTANKQEEEKLTTPIQRKTEYTISTLNSMKKDS